MIKILLIIAFVFTFIEIDIQASWQRIVWRVWMYDRHTFRIKLRGITIVRANHRSFIGTVLRHFGAKTVEFRRAVANAVWLAVIGRCCVGIHLVIVRIR